MEQLTHVIKTVMDKHLIPSVISVTGAIITLLITPENHWTIKKLGNSLFLLLVFCIFFCFIELLVYVRTQIKNFFKYISIQNDDAKYSTKHFNSTVNQVHNFIDKLLPQEKELLMTFIQNNNKILITSNCYRSYDSFFNNSNIIKSSIFTGDISTLDLDHYWIDPDLQSIIKLGMRPLEGFMQYKLQDELFSILKHIYISTGKLGNF